MIVKSSELTRTRREVGRRNGKKGEKVLMGLFLATKSRYQGPQGRKVQNQARKMGGESNKQKNQGRVVDGEAAGCRAQEGCKLSPRPWDWSGKNPALFVCH